jgi:hypothetical protein
MIYHYQKQVDDCEKISSKNSNDKKKTFGLNIKMVMYFWCVSNWFLSFQKG